MKVVILAGGFGTRLSEYTDSIPKPMVEIGGKPIIWHIMKRYADYGYKDFVIALGYKGEVIKNYFASYHLGQNDYTVNLASGKTVMSSNGDLDWNVTLVDTGLNTMTGGRIKRLREYLKDENFMLTYGDGVADVDIKQLVEHHADSNNLVTLTAVRPTARFGELELNDSLVVAFQEKSQLNVGWVNGGFFVCEPQILDFIESDSVMLEREPLERIARESQLGAFKHHGFWQCMDSKRDRDLLQSLCDEGNQVWLDI
jgi:glucose-1-phosphate cytidylyltransferase